MKNTGIIKQKKADSVHFILQILRTLVDYWFSFMAKSRSKKAFHEKWWPD